MITDRVARRIAVNGIVQGVGFRPFVFQLARQFNLTGSVANTSSGVDIHVEGCLESIASFTHALKEKAPPLSRITTVTSTDAPVKPWDGFTIADSRASRQMATLIPPDISICDDCLRELLDPHDRRFHYPFINCTNCGPRYTIIEDIPYDRPNTSMKHFPMCSDCQAEYDAPESRRFHAQPNACEHCGPNVSMWDNGGNRLESPNPVEQAATLIKQGHIVAIKGLGGFHLAVDAKKDQAVARLRERKHREEKPFALMAYDIGHIETFAHVDPEEAALLGSPQRPIVLLIKKEPNVISKNVAPDNRYFGVMLPYTPLHYLLLNHDFTALVMTSGNIGEEPIAIDNGEAIKRLAGIADYFLMHNRDIYIPSDDSIVKISAGSRRFIRRSRGYAPVPLAVNKALLPILACGAELKNTVCLTRDNNVFISQHIGDLENQATYDYFTFTIEHMARVLDIRSEIVAFDLHPDYLSTRYAEKQPHLHKIRVQHHHAHIVSVMGEHRLTGPVIGLAFDGTGYGENGTIWGGEFLVADMKRFSRVAHFNDVPMPGSTVAIKEPWRMAVSYLYHTFGESFRNLDLPLLKTIEPEKIDIIVSMMKKKINSPLTSSLGRLFDGIAALLGIRYHVTFEGQAAMALEMLADDTVAYAYDYGWDTGNGYTLLIEPIIQGVVQDMAKGVNPALISGKYHRTLISLSVDLCNHIRKDNGLNRVVLSGGVFQNHMLLTGLFQALKTNQFEAYTNARVPVNDGGICLGQALVAAANVT